MNSWRFSIGKRLIYLDALKTEALLNKNLFQSLKSNPLDIIQWTPFDRMTFFSYKDESIDSKLSKSIANVNIFLTDLNDNPPMFLQNPYEYKLTDIYTRNLLWLNATDPDEGLNAEFEFALHGETRVSRG